MADDVLYPYRLFRMPDAPNGWVVCALCQRQVPPQLITLHHLKPKQKGGKPEHRVPMCRTCHKQIHATFGNHELARGLDDVKLLRQSPQLAPFLRWIRRQSPDRSFRTVMSNDHSGSKRRRLRERRDRRRG